MRRAMRAAGLVPAALIFMAGLATAAPVPAAGSARAGWNPHGTPPVTHVIEIMLENHTFEDLFPALAGADGRARPRVVSAPPNEGDVAGGVDNSRAAELRAMDDKPGTGYLMDRFTQPPYTVSAVTTFGAWADPNLQYLAQRYEIAGRNFQPTIGPTRPNIMMALNGTAHDWYFNRPDPHPTPWYSIFDELTGHGRSWKIYLSLRSPSARGRGWYDLVPPGYTGDVTTTSHFYADLSSHQLPSFSFVRPGFGYSEEPREDISEGDAWLGQLVNAVAHSRYWKSTAIFITYDEGGGFWDPMAPTVASGYGTRTPMVIVSPWARRGVFHPVSTNASILSFMQHLWGLPPLTSFNSVQNDLAAAFDFGQRPLSRPDVPLAPPDTIGFHGRVMTRQVHRTFPHTWLRIYLDAENGALTLDQGMSGTLHLTVTPPHGVTVKGFPGQTSLVNGRAMVRARFPRPGYYRVEATGPGGSVGWTTLVVLKPHQHHAHLAEGLPRRGL
jgi:phospholipase C